MQVPRKPTNAATQCPRQRALNPAAPKLPNICASPKLPISRAAQDDQFWADIRWITLGALLLGQRRAFGRRSPS
jgi:hypothetical protein